MTPSDFKNRVGILTFHNGPNYGAFMQAWHLRTAIRSLGFEASTINYLHNTHIESNRRWVRVRDLQTLKMRIHWIMRRYPFRNVEKVLCDDPFTTNSAEVPWSKYETLVVGSDIVWDFQDPEFGHDPAYFDTLAGQRECRMVSYAASCGPASTEGELPSYCNGLQRFMALGVRDSASVNLVKRVTGREASLVVDPTWLQPDPEGSWLRAPDKGYILIYGTGMPEDFALSLRKYCDQKGLKIISAAAACKIADHTYRMLSPFQWVDLIRKADGCVIGGLHGTLYSIKYKKPFILINNARTRQKAQEALAGSNQEFRGILPENVRPEHLSLLTPDSGLPAGVPEAWRGASWDFLRNALATSTMKP